MGGVLSHQPFRSPGGLRSSLFQLLIDLSPYPLPWAPLLYPATPPVKTLQGPLQYPAKAPALTLPKTPAKTPQRPCYALQHPANDRAMPCNGPAIPISPLGVDRFGNSTFPGRPLGVLLRFREGPRGGPRGAQEGSKWALREAQEPKRAKESPRRAPRGSQTNS